MSLFQKKRVEVSSGLDGPKEIRTGARCVHRLRDARLGRLFACLNVVALVSICGWVWVHTSSYGTLPALLLHARSPLDRGSSVKVDRQEEGLDGEGSGESGTLRKSLALWQEPQGGGRKRNRLIKLDEDSDYDMLLANQLKDDGIGSGSSSPNAGRSVNDLTAGQSEDVQWCSVRKRFRQVLQAPPSNWAVGARRLTCGSEDLGCDCTWASQRLCHIKHNDGSLCFATCCCEVACDSQLKKMIKATVPWCRNTDVLGIRRVGRMVPELRLRPTIHDIATKQIESTAQMSHGCDCRWANEGHCNPS